MCPDNGDDRLSQCTFENAPFSATCAGTTAGIMFLAFIMDVIVWHKANRIDIDPESRARSADYTKTQPSITPESSV